MQYLYPFIIAFMFIFFSELGDKTQILVLSFSARNRASNILLGVALGTLLSHGLAIAFGSHIGMIGNNNFICYLKIFTYFTFLFFGITGFIKRKKLASVEENTETNSNSHIIKFLGSLTKNCVFIVASSIAIGELGDKTFLASIGLGLQYPLFKIPLICGSICGMVASNSIAIFFGKWLGTKISASTIEILSNAIFIFFGLIGILGLFL
ncbi:MAG: TMEM165/GDT1 family protein [Clostridia bacterium]|nr:TMEM165/GDT1 family protein [Clostridia bacterium]